MYPCILFSDFPTIYVTQMDIISWPYMGFSQMLVPLNHPCYVNKSFHEINHPFRSILGFSIVNHPWIDPVFFRIPNGVSPCFPHIPPLRPPLERPHREFPAPEEALHRIPNISATTSICNRRVRPPWAEQTFQRRFLWHDFRRPRNSGGKC